MIKSELFLGEQAYSCHVPVCSAARRCASTSAVRARGPRRAFPLRQRGRAGSADDPTARTRGRSKRNGAVASVAGGAGWRGRAGGRVGTGVGGTADKVLQPRCIECIVSLSRIGWAELRIGAAPRGAIGLSMHGKGDTAPPGGDVVDMELLYVPADATAAALATV